MVAADGSFRQVVEEFHREFMEAVKRGDAASIAASFTEDGTLLPPNMETVRGRQAIEALLGIAMGTMGLREATLRTVSIEEDGDVAFEIGDLTMTYKPQGGQARTDQGKYVLLWKRQTDGKWECYSEMWNSNSPPPAM